jgi:HAD superfamily hydrolase (TIGR01450 family)
LYVTNMSRLTVAEQEAKLARHGIDAAGRVVTSAMAAATMVEPGERALVIGGPGVVEALGDRGVEIVPAGARCDVVVVGMDPGFDYEDMKAATLAIRGGARFVATNHDPTFPTPEGLVPGAGAIVAAIEVATGTDATVCGKPHPPMVDLVHDLVGAEGIVVGDRADTDGAFAVALGFGFALVFSGATSEADLPVDPTPVHTAADLASLVDVLAGEPAR